jgi:hypothetical protein
MGSIDNIFNECCDKLDDLKVVVEQESKPAVSYTERKLSSMSLAAMDQRAMQEFGAKCGAGIGNYNPFFFDFIGMSGAIGGIGGLR